jgi:hypothetical protein
VKQTIDDWLTEAGVTNGRLLEALKAITINAAYQYMEQTTKGSLENGKRADLVILDKNPLKVDPIAIKDIKVVETIKDGKTIYTAK